MKSYWSKPTNKKLHTLKMETQNERTVNIQMENTQTKTVTEQRKKTAEHQL